MVIKTMNVSPLTNDSFEGYAWPPEIRHALDREGYSVTFDREQLHAHAQSCGQVHFTITFLSREYLALGALWASCARRVGIERFAIGAMDEETVSELQARQIPHFSVKVSDALASQAGFTNRGGFNAKALSIILCRHRIATELLERGINVLCCDIDAIFVRSPLPELSKADLVFQRVVHFPKRLAFQWGFALCGGFVACKARPGIIRLVKTVVDTQREVSSDQLAWNLALEHHQVEWESSSRPAGDRDALFGGFLESAHLPIRGRIEHLGIALLALPATSFWRHKFVNLDWECCVIVHPNSPKALEGKLSVFHEIVSSGYKVPHAINALLRYSDAGAT